MTDREFIFPGFIPVIAKQIVGHVDNSEYPLIDVDIKMILVIPMNVKGPVPVLMMFGFPHFPRRPTIGRRYGNVECNI